MTKMHVSRKNMNQEQERWLPDSHWPNWDNFLSQNQHCWDSGQGKLHFFGGWQAQDEQIKVGLDINVLQNDFKAGHGSEWQTGSTKHAEMLIWNQNLGLSDACRDNLMMRCCSCSGKYFTISTVYELVWIDERGSLLLWKLISWKWCAGLVHISMS